MRHSSANLGRSLTHTQGSRPFGPCDDQTNLAVTVSLEGGREDAGHEAHEPRLQASPAVPIDPVEAGPDYLETCTSEPVFELPSEQRDEMVTLRFVRAKEPETAVPEVDHPRRHGLDVRRGDDEDAPLA